MGIKEDDLIIEAGVGTGLSLPLYLNFCRVVGIDITRKMLDKAKIKKDRFKCCLKSRKDDLRDQKGYKEEWKGHCH